MRASWRIEEAEVQVEDEAIWARIEKEKGPKFRETIRAAIWITEACFWG